MESQRHRDLKSAAVKFLFQGGCAAAASEVRCPIARHIVDAAGYLDAAPKRGGAYRNPPASGAFGRGTRAKTIVIECKQSRADFLSDSRNAATLAAERSRLWRVKQTLEEQILKACEPQLRQSGSALFNELEEWDFSASRVGSYRKVVSELLAVDRQLHGGIKFWMLAHYRLADWLFLAVPRGVVHAGEIPPGWGLLELAEGAGEFSMRTEAPERPGNPEHRQRLLRNIAGAASRRLAGIGTLTPARNENGGSTACAACSRLTNRGAGTLWP